MIKAFTLSITDDNDENDDYNPNALDVFVQTLMFIASKTFTHSFSGAYFRVNAIIFKFLRELSNFWTNLQIFSD